MTPRRSTVLRVLAATAIIASGSIATATPNASAAPGEGSISGTVLDEFGSGLPDVCVSVESVTSTITDGTGAYSLTNVPVGQHRVQFSDCADPRVYLTQWYLGQPDESTAQYVDVYDGTDTPLQDVSMQPGVSVTGRVTDSSNNPIQGIDVHLEPQGPYNSSSGVTDSNGEYRTGPVQDGGYIVRFADNSYPPTHAGEYWNDTYLHSQAAPLMLQVANGTEASGFDAQLAGAATVSGHVQNTSATNLADICVSAHTPSNQGWEWLGGTQSDVNGDYTLAGLPPMQTHIQFEDCNAPHDYAGQWYDGSQSFWQSQALQLNSGSNVTGVDATLAPGTVVQGRVTDSGGNPLQNIWVGLNSEDDTVHVGAATDSNGDYMTSPVPPGNYRVQFQDPNGNYASEFWNDRPTHDDANLINIPGGGPAIGGIDASLATGARISGTVTKPNGSPAPDICIGAEYGTGDHGSGIGYAQTDGSGHYEMAGLPAGAYRVIFVDCNDTGPYINEWYDETHNWDDSTIINLNPGTNRTDVDARMDPAAQISGRVTDSGGTPLPYVCVQAITDDAVGGMTRTDGNGDYALRLDQGGTYRIQFVDCGNPEANPPQTGGNYLGQWWGGGLEPTTASGVTVAQGQIVGNIDAVLAPAGGTGTITGKVTNVRGEPLQSCIALFLPDEFVLFGMTAADGTYTFDNVPTGTWTLGFLGCGPDDVSPIIDDPNAPGVFYWGQWWDGVPLQIESSEAPDPIAQGATLVVVHPNETITASPCFGCGAVEVTKVETGSDFITVAFDTPGIAPDNPFGKTTTKATLSYNVSCASYGGGTPTSATSDSSPVTVKGFSPGVPYVCTAQAFSGDTPVADSTSFDVTVGTAPAPADPDGSTDPTDPAATGSTPAGDPTQSGGSSGSATPRSLAFTGADIALVVLAALAMILMGAGVVTTTLRVGRRQS